MGKHTLRHTGWHQNEHYALVVAVVDMAVVAGALVVVGEADVAASEHNAHQ